LPLFLIFNEFFQTNYFNIAGTVFAELLVCPARLSRPDGLYVLPLFLIVNDFFKTNYFNICRNDLRQLCRFDKTITADDQSEISFFDPSRNVAVATGFCWIYPQN